MATLRSPQKRRRTIRKGAWTLEEDQKLDTYIRRYGIWNWSLMPQFAGLSRSGKSCRLRWLNYLSPNVKRGSFTEEEVETIIKMYEQLGSRWSQIAKALPGRTDNDIKNYWNSRLKKRLIRKNLMPSAQSAVVDFEAIRESSHQIETSRLDNAAEVSSFEGSSYSVQTTSNEQMSAGSSSTTLECDFAGDAEIIQVKTDNFLEMNTGEYFDNYQIPWMQHFMAENLCREDQQVGFLYSEFDLPLWSLESFSPSSFLYNDPSYYTTYVEEPIFLL